MDENAYIKSILNYIGIAADKKNHAEIIINFPVFYVKKHQEYRIKEYQIVSQQFGTFFADFINCDFNEKTNYINFFNKYSLSLLSVDKYTKLFKNGTCTENEYNKFIQTLINNTSKRLIKIQEQLDMILDYTLLNPSNKAKSLSPLQRLYVLERTDETLTILRANKIEYFSLHYFSKNPGYTEKEIIDYLSKNKVQIDSIDCLIPYTIESLLYIQLCDILKEEICFKSCKYCNRYFIAENKKTEYCNNIAPSSTKTCREIGRKKVYYDLMKKDKALQLYNKIYYRKATMANRYPDIKKYVDDYEHFKRIGKKKVANYKSNIITSEDFISWINKNM